jgi:hypothetical protein
VDLTSYQKLCLATGELLAHVGLMGCAMPSFPEQVREAWEERVEAITEDINNEIANIQNFGEAHDEEASDGG